MLHLPRMRTALTVVTALASRLTKEAGMRSYLAVPVDKEVKYESTSPPCQREVLRGCWQVFLVFRNVERSNRDGTKPYVRARGSQRTSSLERNWY